MKKSVNIIIVPWNTLEYTKKAIDSLLKYTKYPYYLTIVDNGSTDGTVEYLGGLKKNHIIKDMKIVYNKNNLGYGGAINIGYEVYDTDYVCVANNDVIFSQNWLTEMIKVMEDNRNIGLLGPLRPAPFCKHPYFKRNTDKVIESINDGLSIDDELFEYCKGRSYENFINDTLEVNDFGIKILSGPPIHIVTCCAILPTDVVNEVGVLSDPIFNNGCDDSDLSWRVCKSGYDLAITSDAYVHHFKHKSTKENKIDVKGICNRNSIKFFKRWKDEIYNYINDQLRKGVDVKKYMSSEDNYDYWLLRRINDNARFWRNGKLYDVKV